MQIKKKCPWLTGIRNLATLSIILMVLSLSNTLNARNFYFSTSIGDDSRTVAQAQNPLTPWKTLNKLNSFFPSLLAGDSVLFKRGEVFDGKIIVTKSGTATAPIVLSAFGTGSKPVINGFTTLSGWTNLGGGIWQAAAPYCKASLNMVTLNGVPQAIGRYPNEGYLTFESANGTTSITDNQLASSPNWTGAEVVIRKTHWVIDRNVITNHTGTVITYSTGSDYPGLPGYGYFIQNDPKTLDKIGEWYFDPVNKKFNIFLGSSNPSIYQIKVSSIDTLIYINGKSHVKVLNISLDGANTTAVQVYSSTNITVQNCSVDFSGNDAIIVKGGASNIVIDNSQILHSNNNAIYMDTWNAVSNSIISNNQIKYTGVIPGGGRSGDNTYQAITTFGANNTIEYNQIDSTGYTGIRFTGDNNLVKNNFVNYFTLVKDDGAGIYPGFPVNLTQGQRIIGNIILNGIGSYEGTNVNTPLSNGIYPEVSDSLLTISENTVAYCINGIYLGGVRNNAIRDNTLFDNIRAQIFISAQQSQQTETRLNRLNKNIIFSKGSTQFNYLFESWRNDFDLLCQSDSNTFSSTTINSSTFNNSLVESGAPFTNVFDLNGWKTGGCDSHSTDLIQTIAPYSTTNLGSNLFSNGSFSNNIIGTSSYSAQSNVTTTWETNQLDGGSLYYSFTNLNGGSYVSTLSINCGSVIMGQSYILKFSLKGSSNMKTMSFYITSDGEVASGIQYFNVYSNRKEYEFLIPMTHTGASSCIIFMTNESAGNFWLDNVTFQQGEISTDSYEDYIKFEFNASKMYKNVMLDGSYIDMGGIQHTGNITLEPYASTILRKCVNLNHPPVMQNQTFGINENSPDGSIIANVNAIDPDTGQILTYSIQSGNTGNAFAINALTGEVSVANITALNYEVNPSFSLVVNVHDNGTDTLSSQAIVTIILTDVNEKPLIANQSFSIDEDFPEGTWIGTVEASDPDFGQTLIYSILSGNIGGAFSINASNGNIEIANSTVVNYERNSSFSLLINVQDNGVIPLFNQKYVIIQINDINEMPVLNDQSYTITDNLQNGSFVGIVDARDPDEGQSLTWSIGAGSTNSIFFINPANGVISVLDQISLSNSSTSIYYLTITVQDNGMGNLITQAIITINVIHVNAPPVIYDQTFFINENSIDGTIIDTVETYDPDPGQSITYSILSGNTSGAFTIDPNTGVISVNNSIAMDYEKMPVFNLVIHVQDDGENSLNSQAAITIILINLNEVPQIDYQQFYITSGVSNGSIVGCINASDPDAGQTLSYSILSGNNGGAFNLNPLSGLLMIANSEVLNNSHTLSYNLQIKVQDNGMGNLSDEATVLVYIQPPLYWPSRVESTGIGAGEQYSKRMGGGANNPQNVTELLNIQTCLIDDNIQSYTKGIFLFPSPASEIVNIIVKGENGNDFLLTFSDMNGKINFQKELKTNHLITIDISKFSRGIYSVSAISSANRFSKIIILN